MQRFGCSVLGSWKCYDHVIVHAVQTPPALDPGPDFPPLVAPMDVDDGAAGYPGGSVEDDADDDVEGHPEQGMSDGEDEEMIMLHVRSSNNKSTNGEEALGHKCLLAQASRGRVCRNVGS